MTDTARKWSKSRNRLLDLPEFNIAIFAFLLNFVWEMWQIPFYSGIKEKLHWQGVWICTRATFGDVVIVLIAFWTVALVVKSRAWSLDLSRPHVGWFILIGVGITIGLEEVSLRTGRWEYAPFMPTLPLLGTGLLPLAQWLLLPPVVMWLVRRQLT